MHNRLRVVLLVMVFPLILIGQEKRTFADHIYLQLDAGVGIRKNAYLSGSHNSTFYEEERGIGLSLEIRAMFRNNIFRLGGVYNSMQDFSAELGGNILFFKSTPFYFGPVIKYGNLKLIYGYGNSPSFGYGVDFYFKKFHVAALHAKASRTNTYDIMNYRYSVIEVGYSFNLDSFRKKENRHAQ